jgi:hypothetical protein
MATDGKSEQIILRVFQKRWPAAMLPDAGG